MRVMVRAEQLVRASHCERKWSAVCDSAQVVTRAARKFRRVRAILHTAAQTRFSADSGLTARIEASLVANNASPAARSTRSTVHSIALMHSPAVYGAFVRH